MGKQGDIDFVKNLSNENRMHVINQPFSDHQCGRYFRDIGTILSLLPPPPAKLLDLGIGTGWTSCFYAMRGYDVTGQDISKDMISFANQNKIKYAVENLEFITSDYENMFFDNEYDCAVFHDSLHHSENEEAAILSVYKSLKKGGVLITAETAVGHANTPVSQESVKKYGVTERDMPVGLIVKAGKKAGFKDFKFYRRPVEPIEILSVFSFKGIVNFSKIILRELWFSNVMKTGHIVVMVK